MESVTALKSQSDEIFTPNSRNKNPKNMVT